MLYKQDEMMMDHSTQIKKSEVSFELHDNCFGRKNFDYVWYWLCFIAFVTDLESKAKMLIDKKRYVKSFKNIAHAIHLKQTNRYQRDDIHTQVVEMAKLFN